MLVVSLVTLGSPEQLTGGYLYHRRMADAAAAHGARVAFVAAGFSSDPRLATKDADVVLVDSIAAWRVAPWVRLRASTRPLAAVVHQPPGGIDHGVVRARAQAVLDRSLYRRCRLVLAASQALADEFVTNEVVPADRIVVVAPGRDVAGPPSDDRPAASDDAPVIMLSIGNWVARKGTIELLDAFARVEPGAAVLHLVGRDDVEPRYTQRIRRRLTRPDLADRVVVHGPVTASEVARLYATADVFVLASYREPYGTVYGEALAAGLPVVGWRAGNLPHLIEDGREGILVPPGDVEGLAVALDQLVRDPTRRRELAVAAERRGEALPTWEDTAKAFFGALAGLAEDAG
jgi:glycosyltransferase involved in cell wall biosynthesis